MKNANNVRLLNFPSVSALKAKRAKIPYRYIHIVETMTAMEFHVCFNFRKQKATTTIEV